MRAVVLGAGGFIGGHLVNRLKKLGYWVKGVDIKRNEFQNPLCDEFILGDLRILSTVELIIDETIDEVYQLAADMGGAEYLFTGENDFDIMHNSALINMNVCDVSSRRNVKKIFYSSSACVYPEYNQMDHLNPKCDESSVYPAEPDSEYGWEKLFSERLYFSLMKNKSIDVRVARFHNIFGPMGTFRGGKEKAPAAMCRKAIEAVENGTYQMEVWGDGKQTRSFLYIDECIEGIIRLMKSENFHGPVNIGSDEMVSINHLANLAIGFADKDIKINNVDVKQIGVRGRNSDNNLIMENLNWKPQEKLVDGLRITFDWIKREMTSSSHRLGDLVHIPANQSEMMISSYRLGDLLYNMLNKSDIDELLKEHPNSIGSKYILQIRNNKRRKESIDMITEIVTEHIEQNLDLLPIDITDSTVIHLRLGDVVSGNECHEMRKRPLPVNYIKSLVPDHTNPKYVIGKCFFAKTSSKNYNECVNFSNDYLHNVINELQATYFNSGNADIDLCCAVKSKLFIQGRGFFSKLIVDIRKKLNLESIETSVLD